MSYKTSRNEDTSKYKWQSCIYAGMRCAEACELCTTSDLKEQGGKMMAGCTQINRQCAAVCWTSASLMSMDSQSAKQFCSCAPIFVMPTPENVKDTKLTTVRDVRKHILQLYRRMQKMAR